MAAKNPRPAIIVHQRAGASASSDSRPMMPPEIQTLVLPSQLGLPVLKVPPNPRSNKKLESLDSDADDDDIIDAAAPQIVSNYRNRYVPRFDTKTNRCWWEWIEYDLDDEGREINDLKQISDDAWDKIWKENFRREQQQISWWNQNPQH